MPQYRTRLSLGGGIIVSRSGHCISKQISYIYNWMTGVWTTFLERKKGVTLVYAKNAGMIRSWVGDVLQNLLDYKCHILYVAIVD